MGKGKRLYLFRPSSSHAAVCVSATSATAAKKTAESLVSSISTEPFSGYDWVWALVPRVKWHDFRTVKEFRDDSLRRVLFGKGIRFVDDRKLYRKPLHIAPRRGGRK